MPSFVMWFVVKCHQVSARASGGGFLKSFSRLSALTATADANNANSAAIFPFIICSFFFVSFKEM